MEAEHGDGAHARRKPVERRLERSEAAVDRGDGELGHLRLPATERQEALAARELQGSRRGHAKSPSPDRLGVSQPLNTAHDVDPRFLGGVLRRPGARTDHEPRRANDVRRELVLQLVQRSPIAADRSTSRATRVSPTATHSSRAALARERVESAIYETVANLPPCLGLY
jgi:hypothetical protein